VDDKLAQKIKVNWAPKAPKDLVLVGVLPSVRAPSSVLESKYCQVTVMEGEGVELHFSLLAKVGPASQMKAVLPGESTALLGEPLSGGVTLTLTDQYGNHVPMTSAMCADVSCHADSLDSQLVTVQATPTHEASVGHLVFSQMGHKELLLCWGDLKATQRCDVLAGPPSQVKVVDWPEDQTVSTYSQKPLPFPLKVQLMDAQANVSKVADVKVHYVKDSKLKVSGSPAVKTNQDGLADFGLMTLTADRGSYCLQIKASVGRITLNGPKLTLEILADPNKPVAMDVSYNNKMTVIAGHNFSDFQVKVMSEEGNPLSTGSVEFMAMKLWRKEFGNKPTNKALDIAPEVPSRTQQGTYHFKKIAAPTISADYNMMFLYSDGTYEVYSQLISMTVQPGSPATLMTPDPSPTATVSNTRSVASRTLIKYLKLQMQDEFANNLGQGYDGQVKVTISGPDSGDDLPTFVSGSSCMTFALKSGQCVLQSLVLQENSPGKDGFEYKLSCSVSCDSVAKNRPLKPLLLPFLFYNDARKQQQMASLSRERDKLQATIQAYRDMFDTEQQLISELRATVHEAQKTEENLRSELTKQNIPSNQIQNVDKVEKLISARTRDRDHVLTSPRRACGLSPCEVDADVLGKIGHLALVHQDELAQVLSWHMMADMDCVVTMTTAKAKDLYHRTQGKQQVLPLDSIYRKNLPDWDKALPHARFLPNYRPTGNPVYARTLLEFTKDVPSCRVVMGMLLGDTLILDTLDAANAYRQEIIKHTHCPTILTRSGDRIRSNGKFGGAMNKAPPMDKMKGCVFGQPLPIAYHAVCTQIESLEKYKAALASHINAEEELQEMVEHQKQADVKDKFQECKEAERRLKEVETKLGVATPVQKGKHSSRTPRDDSEPGLKKPKLEIGVTGVTASPSPRAGRQAKTPTPAAELMDPSLTPARTSRRIAGMTTVVTDDGRRRLKKSM